MPAARPAKHWPELGVELATVEQEVRDEVALSPFAAVSAVLTNPDRPAQWRARSLNSS
jgi:hypothetical protein